MSASTLKEEDDQGSEYSKEKDNTSVDAGSSKASALKDGNSADNGDSICLQRSRLFVLALVAIIAAIAGAATFIYTSNNQDEEFESKVSSADGDIKNIRSYFSLFALILTLYHSIPA